MTVAGGKHVYFVRPIGSLGPIKIGCSKMPPVRLDVFMTWSPVRLELICAVPGTHGDERTLHGMFAHCHVHGEWFGASKELLALIEHCEETGALPELPKVVRFPRVRHIGHRGRATGKREPGTLSPEKTELARLLRGQHESGISIKELAREHGKAVQTISKYIRAVGGEIKWPLRTATGIADTDRADLFRDMYLGGKTLREIGDQFGITRERVRQILRKSNVPSLGRRPEHNRQPHELTAEELRAVELYRDGTSPGKIIEATGITYDQLSTALDRCGVERKPKGFWMRRPDDAEITQRVCDLYTKGFSAPQIAKRVPQIKFPETVYRYLKKGGVSPRTKKGRRRHHQASASAA